MSLNYADRKLLEIMKGRLLITKAELNQMLNGQSEMSAVSLERLQERGYLETVESFSNCIVITQKGLRALEDQ